MLQACEAREGCPPPPFLCTPEVDLLDQYLEEGLGDEPPDPRPMPGPTTGSSCGNRPINGLPQALATKGSYRLRSTNLEPLGKGRGDVLS